MGYLDGLVEPQFKTDDQGRDLYFPWGIYGKGRVLPDAAATTRLRGRLKTMYVMMFVAIGVLILFGSILRDVFNLSFLGELLILIPVALLLGGAMQAYIFSHLRGLPISDQTLSLKEAHQAQAKSFGTSWLIALVALCVPFVFGGMYLIFAGPSDLFWFGVFTTVLFGACLLLFVRMIVFKARQ